MRWLCQCHKSKILMEFIANWDHKPCAHGEVLDLLSNHRKPVIKNSSSDADNYPMDQMCLLNGPMKYRANF